MQAVAWRRYRQAGEGYGGRWFELARAWSPDGKGDAKLNEGLALTMRAIGRNAAAEDIVYPWIGQYPAMKKLYVDIGVEELSRDNPPEPMEEARIARYVGVIAPMQSALGAQALAWYRYARGENDDAVKWFKSALDWWPKPKDGDDKKLLVPVDDYRPILAKLALAARRLSPHAARFPQFLAADRAGFAELRRYARRARQDRSGLRAGAARRRPDGGRGDARLFLAGSLAAAARGFPRDRGR